MRSHIFPSDPPPSTCEAVQASLSALLDGELDALEFAPVVDHLVDCADCRRFHEQARSLDGLVATAAGIGRDTPPAPEAVWDRIVAEPAPQARRSWSRSWPAWASAAAASLVLGLGLAFVAFDGQAARSPGLPDSGGSETEETVLIAGRGAMTEARFVELARELLQADRRYHRAMYEVIQTATSGRKDREGSAEVRIVDSEDDRVRTEAMEAVQNGQMRSARRPRS